MLELGRMKSAADATMDISKTNGNVCTEEVTPRVRRLPFQDNIHTTIFTPQDYQVELLDAAKKRNMTICLGNGASKAFVALMLIKEIAHKVRSRRGLKWIVIIFSSVQLIRRYIELIQDHTDLNVGEYVEKNPDDDDVNSSMNGKQVLVMTVQIFEEMLESGTLSLSQVDFLIVGESHNAAALDHPMRHLMDSIVQSKERPRLLGLSAIIMKNHCEEPYLLEMYMDQLETTMQCVAETTSDLVSLSRFGNRSNEIVAECGLSHKDNNTSEKSESEVLEMKIRNIVEPALNFVTDHVYRPDEIYGYLDEDFKNIPDPTIIPKFYLNELLHLLGLLGPWCVDRAARRFMKELKKHKEDTPFERHYLLISMVFTVMEMVRATCEDHFRDMKEDQKILMYSSVKVLRLLEILKHFKPSQSGEQASKKESSRNMVVPNVETVGESNEIAVNELTESIDEKIAENLSNSIKDLKLIEIEDKTMDLHNNYINENNVQITTLEQCKDNNKKTHQCSEVEICDKLNKENLRNDHLTDAASNIKQGIREVHFNILSRADGRREKSIFFGPRNGINSRREFGNKNRMYAQNFNVDDPTALCGLVFVDKRNTACIMHFLLKELSRNHEDFGFISPNFLVGHTKSLNEFHHKHNETRELMIEHRKQEEVLRRFRLRECNLLVATSVLQDGIDIPKSNLVVRFDLAKDYRAYVQCKGRARAASSHFIHLVETSEKEPFLSDLARFKTIEEILLKRCHEREIPTDEEIVLQLVDGLLPFYSPNNKENAAKVTLSTAISLVNRYCAKLPSDTFTRLTPRCSMEEIGIMGDGSQICYRAILHLPINSPVKEPVVGPAMPNRALAKMAVALKMCEVLHLAGELDDNLLPVGKESIQYEEELMEQWEEEVVPEGTPKPGTTKRRQYYYKRTADAFLNCLPKKGEQTYLYVIEMTLTCPIPEEQNTRGRKIYAPEETTRCFGILTSKPIPKICGFPVFTRSGEVTVSLREMPSSEFENDQLSRLSFFHNFVFTKVLRLEKYPMKYDPSEAESSYFIVPLNKVKDEVELTVDWDFVNLINQHQDFKPHLISDKDRANFAFDVSMYNDSVVMPWYRNLDQPQYFYVAEICYNLNPRSDFPDDEFETFEKYYFKKYNIQIQNLSQPLLDVDHTSARLNLLTPRYVNRKGVALPTSSEETKRAKRENLQQKQILVPELCTIHPFPASFWRKAVCLPCILYRINCLLIAEQLRVRVAKEIGLGLKEIGDSFEWPVLGFGWNLADVLKAHAQSKEARAALEETKEKSKEPIEKKDKSDKKTKEDRSCRPTANKSKPAFVDPASGDGFDIGTWSNDMAVSEEMNEEDDSFDDCSLPSNLLLLNNGGIFGDDEEDDEVAQINESGCSWSSEPETVSDSRPAIRYGSPSNFEDMGWDFDSNEEVDVMNFPGFSFIAAPNTGFNLEDLSRDIEAYEEEDGVYQMQTETFEDDEEKGDYPGVSCWDGNSETNVSTKGAGTEVMNFEDIEDDVILKWESTKPPEVIDEMEMSMKDDFSLRIKTKKKAVNVVPSDKELHLCLQESNSKSCICKKPSESQSSLAGTVNQQVLEETKDCIAKVDGMHVSNNVMDKNSSKQPKDDCNIKSFNSNCDSAHLVECAPKSIAVINETLLSVTHDSSKDECLAFSFDEQASLESHPGPSPSVILQALTMSNANDGINLERLETIGDSFLKHAITTYLYCTYPNIHEGKLSYLRSKQVSNLNLYRLEKKKGFGECMVATKFEPNDNWLPPGYFVPKELEQALIDSGIPAGHWNIANLPDFNDWKDLDAEQIRKALVKASEAEGENGTCLPNIEELVPMISNMSVPSNVVVEGQIVVNPDEMICFIPYNLMTQHSIPDKSIADCVEALIGAYLTSCGPRGALLFMSWLGIKVLPRLEDGPDGIPLYGHLNPPPSPLLRIVENPEAELEILLSGYDKFEEKIGYRFRDRSYLLQAFTHASYHYNTLTDCYQRLEFLGDAVLDYLITRHLYEDPRQHSPGTLTDLRSALVNNTIFATLAVKYDFHKYFKEICPGLFVVIDKFVIMQKKNNHKINEEYYFIEEDECEEAEDIEVPKALGDVFESVAGAIYLDSGMSLDTVWMVYYKMMKNEIEQFMTNVPKSPIRELLEMEPETAKFGIPEKTLDGKVRVTVEIFGKGKFRGLGRNYRIAKCTAAKHALKALKRLQGNVSL